MNSINSINSIKSVNRRAVGRSAAFGRYTGPSCRPPPVPVATAQEDSGPALVDTKGHQMSPIVYSNRLTCAGGAGGAFSPRRQALFLFCFNKATTKSFCCCFFFASRARAVFPGPGSGCALWGSTRTYIIHISHTCLPMLDTSLSTVMPPDSATAIRVSLEPRTATHRILLPAAHERYNHISHPCLYLWVLLQISIELEFKTS